MKTIVFVIFLFFLSPLFVLAETQVFVSLPPSSSWGYDTFSGTYLRWRLVVNPVSGIPEFVSQSVTGQHSAYSETFALRVWTYDSNSSVWTEQSQFVGGRYSVDYPVVLSQFVEDNGFYGYNPNLGSPSQQFPTGAFVPPPVVPPPVDPPPVDSPPPPLRGIDLLFTAADFSEFGGNIFAFLIIFIGVSLFFLGYCYIKKSIGRAV